jgi:hypothetical protein
MTVETLLRPVHAIFQALEELDQGLRGGAPAHRGPARRRAVNASRALPPGALDREVAARVAARWQAHFEPDFPPPEATGAPPPEVGATYWLSSGDALGAVLRVRLERPPPRSPPFPEFWPCAVPDRSESAAADGSADAAADRVYARLARMARFTPSEPLRGWHRVVPVEAASPADWRGLRIEGVSLGAALGLMIASYWLGAPLDPTLAVTGDLDDSLRLVLPAGSREAVAAKVRAVERERACVRRVLVPRGLAPAGWAGRTEVVEVDDFIALARHFGLRCDDLAPPPHSIPSWLAAVNEAEWLIQTRAAALPVMRKRLESLRAALVAVSRPGERPACVDVAHFRVLGRLCGLYTHEGEVTAALDLHRDIDDLVASCHRGGHDLPFALTATVRNAQASAMIDGLRFTTARTYAAEGLAAASGARDSVEGARIAGTMARVEAHARRDGEALLRLSEALAALEQTVPWETNICHVYLVGVLGRLGQGDEARAALADARRRSEGAPGMSEGWRADNALYLDYESLKLALLLSERDAAVARLHDCEARIAQHVRGSWPTGGILVRGVEALLAVGERRAAELRVERLRRLAAPGLAPATPLLGQAAALFAIDDATRTGRVDEALLDNVRRYLAAIPDGEENPLRVPRDACLAALRSGPRAPDLIAPLRALLDADIY